MSFYPAQLNIMSMNILLMLPLTCIMAFSCPVYTIPLAVVSTVQCHTVLLIHVLIIIVSILVSEHIKD